MSESFLSSKITAFILQAKDYVFQFVYSFLLFAYPHHVFPELQFSLALPKVHSANVTIRSSCFPYPEFVS